MGFKKKKLIICQKDNKKKSIALNKIVFKRLTTLFFKNKTKHANSHQKLIMKTLQMFLVSNQRFLQN